MFSRLTTKEAGALSPAEEQGLLFRHDSGITRVLPKSNRLHPGSPQQTAITATLSPTPVPSMTTSNHTTTIRALAALHRKLHACVRVLDSPFSP